MHRILNVSAKIYQLLEISFHFKAHFQLNRHLTFYKAVKISEFDKLYDLLKMETCSMWREGHFANS